ncbi:hypothetical protein [Actinomyces lilanjuaniae]|uniref:hypothetical protein n=1 Tax=Actinomyces lilanjuaniae TaxID=2321394 RepID=UPI001FAA24A4|nr:hypothetical protein [Actinomyces lilanjuaniae]
MSRGVVRHVVVAVCLVVCVVLCGWGFLVREDARVGRMIAQASASASAAGVQVGAPYPADTDHLEEILSIGEGNSLPEGARVVSVGPAVRFEEGFPGGWGYVIAFTAEEQAIRDYVDAETARFGANIEDYPVVDSTPMRVELADLDLGSISRPWDEGLAGGGSLVLERPLGRGWLVIHKGGR